MLRPIASIFIILLLLASTTSAQTPPPQGPPSIVTHGEATLKRPADRAWLLVSTEVRLPKADEARKKNAEAMLGVQKALKGAGIADDAIRTVGYSLTPDMEYVSGSSRLRGFIVRNQIEVRVDDLDRLGDVIDAANIPRGAILSITGPRFDLKNRQAAETQVLRQAVEQAMVRAQAIAQGAGRGVGPIIRIEEQHVNIVSPVPFRTLSRAGAGAAAEAQPETPISPGEIEVRGQVTLTVEIR